MGAIPSKQLNDRREWVTDEDQKTGDDGKEIPSSPWTHRSEETSTKISEIDLEKGLVEQTLTGVEGVSLYTLMIRAPKEDVKQFPISQGEFRVGRKVGRMEGDIVLSHPSVSAIHCRFICEDGVVYLEDSQSTNGTFLNGKKMEPHRRVILDEKDRIFIGQVRARVQIPPPPEIKLQEEQIPVISVDKGPRVSDFSPSRADLSTATQKQKEQQEQQEEEDTTPDKEKKLAGVLTRVFALVGDFSSTVFISSFLSDIPFLKTFLSKWDLFYTQEIAPLYEGDPFAPFFEQFVLICVLFYVIRFFSTLVLGVSLFQFLMGVRTVNNTLFSRFGNLLRLGWEILLGGFLIFDLPVLFRKRTLKEFLSGTFLQEGSLPLRLVGSVLLCPICILLMFASDFFTPSDFRSGLQVGEFNIQPKAQHKGDASGGFLRLNSRVYGLSSNFALDESQFMIFLGYDIISRNKKKVFRPRISLFDRNLQDFATLRLRSANPLNKVLSSKEINPFFFQARYPEMKHFLSSYDGPLERGEKYRSLEKSESQELRKLLSESLGMNGGEILRNFFQGQFLISVPLKIRKALVKHLPLDPQSDLQWVLLNQRYFLKITPPQRAQKGKTSRQKTFLLPVDTLNGPFYELSYSVENKGELIVLAMLESLFHEGEFYFDRPWPLVGETLLPEEVTLGRFVDSIFNSKTPWPEISLLYGGYLSYVEKIIDAHISSEKKTKETRFLLKELSSLVELDRVLNKRYDQWNKEFAGRGFQAQLDRLKRGDFLPGESK